jgi:glycine dehydrogenase
MPLNFSHNDEFIPRHIGPDEPELKQMLKVVGANSLDEFIESVIPQKLRSISPLQLPPAKSEQETLSEIKSIASKNKIFRSLIGMGYNDTLTPTVILRNVLENPAWYTAYTPYQAEIAQGRLEALLNFQTMVMDLTGLDVANASLLDEATAAAEAMTMFLRMKSEIEHPTFFVSEQCHPQTIDVIHTRAKPLGINIIVGNHYEFQFTENVFGALLQYPTTDGAVYDYRSFCELAHKNNSYVVVAADLLSLALLTSPGEFGADCCVGNSQRFGVPLGYGGPHAAFFAIRDEFKRQMPGRIIGVSVDQHGKHALRMALQTREQHIRREKATSNICTAQVLLAVIASMYAVYHGQDGIRKIAERIHNLTKVFARGLQQLGFKILNDDYFDTLRVVVENKTRTKILSALRENEINLRQFDDGSLGISFDETCDEIVVNTLLKIFSTNSSSKISVKEISENETSGYQGKMKRTSSYLTYVVFNKFHSETEMMRYIRSLEEKDLSLIHSMISLGSCTMKLNAATEMLPVTWSEFGKIHPFAPLGQTQGYQELFLQLENMLKEITGFSACSLQPNSGAQGEYAGLLAIHRYHESKNESHRNVCLIPSSAHGTNPASAVMAGMNVVVVRANADGTIDLNDLQTKANEHEHNLAALMVTYPSTHGVFEESIKDICDIVHRYGGLVYMDGANLNAQVGLCRPAELGADVCHINLHKTFCIPHGGGGPGIGPICVNEKLAAFLPSNVNLFSEDSHCNAVSSAMWGSASILVISWSYIRMMGSDGLTRATQFAILNANYMAKRLEQFYPIVYKGNNERNAHEFILDCRQFKTSAGIEVEDIAKRLIDYGFHAPTVSFPVVGTMMIEPTESEPKDELDRFCEALISIRKEIEEIENGMYPKENNVLKNAPHSANVVVSDAWNYPYSREKAAYPTQHTRTRKFWPSVGRVNSAHGDRNLICSCVPMDYDS